MKYRLTCLTPVLVGDGSKLSPIDYMVWKDHVNVLDQRRIFNLLAKGPRLDNYLKQLKQAEKLDFASWGGFAQNFAGRRIPFEHPSLTAHWENAKSDSLHIPIFFAGSAGPYLPGSAIKGALRTGLVFEGLKAYGLERVAARFRSERTPKRPAEPVEEETVGGNGRCRMRVVRIFDSKPVSFSSFKIYLLRISTLIARGREHYELGWKQSPRGTVDAKRVDESATIFAEMAVPGVVFEGAWQDNDFLAHAEVHRSLSWEEPVSRPKIFRAANEYAKSLITLHKQYAESVGLSEVAESMENLRKRLTEINGSGDACLLSIGWGGGLLGKVAWLQTEDQTYREIISQTPQYGKAISSLFPFPKTRRVVFLGNRPATLPGFALLEVFSS